MTNAQSTARAAAPTRAGAEQQRGERLPGRRRDWHAPSYDTPVALRGGVRAGEGLDVQRGDRTLSFLDGARALYQFISERRQETSARYTAMMIVMHSTARPVWLSVVLEIDTRSG